MSVSEREGNNGHNDYCSRIMIAAASSNKAHCVNLIGQWHIAVKASHRVLLSKTLSVSSLQSAQRACKDLLIAIQAIIICLSHRRIIYLCFRRGPVLLMSGPVISIY